MGLKDTDFRILGDTVFGNITNGINNSSFDIYGNATFGNISVGINEGTNIRIDGDAVFGKISNGINKANIYINRDAHFDSISNGINNSKICVKGKLSGQGIVKDKNGNYPDGVYSYQDNPAGYINAGCPPIKEPGNNTPSNFDPSLINLHTRVTVRYQ